MINFFKKEEKPKITFWTTVNGLEKVVPVVPAKKYIPEWFKKIPPGIPAQGGSLEIHSTVKRCPGFIDFVSKGYVVPLWTDLYVRVSKDGSVDWEIPTGHFNFEFHSHEQFLKYLPEDANPDIKAIMKPICPWHAKTSPGYNLLQFPMFYEFNDIFTVLPGVYESDRYYEINQQLCFLKEGEHLLKRGTPLALYVPYKREEFDFEVKVEDEELKNARDELGINISTMFYNRLVRSNVRQKDT